MLLKLNINVYAVLIAANLLSVKLRHCKVDLLQFLHRFMSAAGKAILAHVVDIKDTCRAVFNSDKYSDVRCCTFPIVAKVEFTRDSQDIHERDQTTVER